MTSSMHREVPFEFLLGTLPGWPDVGLIRAVAQAGGLGVLNLEAVPADESRAALGDLGRALASRIGVRLRIDDDADLDIVAALPDGLALVVVAGGDAAHMAQACAALAGRASRRLWEATSLEHARLGVAAGADGLMARGYEGGGHVGDETTYVLVQRLLKETDRPVWASGGIGVHAAAACRAAGCAGVWLDVQLALLAESSLPDATKTVIRRLAGDETLVLGAELGAPVRVLKRPRHAGLERLQRVAAERSGDADREAAARTWRAAVRAEFGWTDPAARVWPLGQDASQAAVYQKQFASVASVVRGLREAVEEHATVARRLTPLAPGGPLARSHGTTYPILQGPMTRVSDVAAFADAVAAGGGLPFLALALLRGPQVRALLRETRERLGDRPWGVGILGFVPLELRQEQLEVVREFTPPYALIAGGRPDQAAALEQDGTHTYLHVPSPSLLRHFVEDGARRFIFEGLECGGHVGPRSSFVLWDAAVEVIAEAIGRGAAAADFHVVFAGGIHDARSAAAVSALAAPLAKLGARVGVLLGTAYLFTREAVDSGAIVEGFQDAAVHCTRTVLLETGPGHATRCAESPYCDTFDESRRRLRVEQRPAEEVRDVLESLNLGRLRIASKGITRTAEAGGPARYERVDEARQRAEGMFMIGQVAALRSGVSSIADLHADVSEGSARRLAALAPASAALRPRPAPRETDAAIIGMGVLLPRAQTLRALWANIIGRVDAIREVPIERFDVNAYYAEDRKARDRVYSRWGGFLEDVRFDPMRYGIPPATLGSIDPFQLLSLEVVDRALADAGYGDRPFDREKASVILGASGGLGELGFRYGVRSGLPMYLDPVPDEVLKRLPEWTEDSFAGVLLNVAAGRVANRFNLGGVNFTVDAACASSLAALYIGTRELEQGTSDMVIVGGIDTVNSPFGYLCFSSAQALSPRGRCRTFDESADGIAISEGLAVVVLKRLADAERDGDRIYSVVRGVAGSSDGRGRGLTAPRPEGQVKALERAWTSAGLAPAAAGLIEAHGTGTVAGDGAEVQALSVVFDRAGADAESVAIGSVKSMIGHTKSAAGITGLVKVAMALHERVLPPTLHVQRPNARLRQPGTAFFVNTQPMPWVRPASRGPRAAGVSSFGFGGTNFHAVVEEYVGDGARPRALAAWPAELFAWGPAPAPVLAASLGAVAGLLDAGVEPAFAELASAVAREAPATGDGLRLAIVATDLADLRRKIEAARDALAGGQAALDDSSGIFLRPAGTAAGPLAFLYPGQGSQHPWMHRDLAVAAPEIREAVERAEQVLDGRLARRLGSYIYPPPAFEPAEDERRLREITDTVVAQPALGAVEVGLTRLLARAGVVPAMAAGHSYGEYVALWAAGAFDEDTLYSVSEARGRAIVEGCRGRSGSMAAVSADAATVTRVLEGCDDVWVANLNAPKQTVIAGTPAGLTAATARLEEASLTVRRFPVAAAFHTPLMDAARARLLETLNAVSVQAPRFDVFSNTLAAPHPQDAAAIRTLLGDHLVRPVRFVDEIRAMYDKGARVFVEVGPKAVLSGLTRQALGDEAVVLPLDAPGRDGVVQLLHVLAQLAVRGVPVNAAALADGRSAGLTLEELAARHAKAAAAPAWYVNGSRVRPASGVDRPMTPVRLATTVAAPAPEPPATEPAAETENAGQVMPMATIASYESPRDPRPTAARAVPVNGHGLQGQVMLQFQQLMSQFLQTQALVMTSYLQGVPGNGHALEAPMALAPVAAAAPEWSAPIEAPSEVPSVAAAPAPAPAAAAPAPAPAPAPVPAAVAAAPAPAAPPAPAPAAPVPAPARAAAPVPVGPEEVTRRLLAIVADRTGYPEEMLALDANIEADLGIDSIKRVEILTTFQRTYLGEAAGQMRESMERINGLKTLGDIGAALAEVMSASQPQTALS